MAEKLTLVFLVQHRSDADHHYHYHIYAIFSSFTNRLSIFHPQNPLNLHQILLQSTDL